MMMMMMPVGGVGRAVGMRMGRRETQREVTWRRGHREDARNPGIADPVARSDGRFGVQGQDADLAHVPI